MKNYFIYGVLEILENTENEVGIKITISNNRDGFANKVKYKILKEPFAIIGIEILDSSIRDYVIDNRDDYDIENIIPNLDILRAYPNLYSKLKSKLNNICCYNNGIIINFSFMDDKPEEITWVRHRKEK